MPWHPLLYNFIISKIICRIGPYHMKLLNTKVGIEMASIINTLFQAEGIQVRFNQEMYEEYMTRIAAGEIKNA